MNKPIRKPLMLLCLVAAAFLAACGGATPTPAAVATSAPTADLNALRTEVAATVLAQVPQLCAQTPSPTVPPTATAKPTTAPTATAAAVVTLASSTPGAGTPTATLLDQVKWVSQTVADGTTFKPDTDFTMTWRVQNTGTSTWSDKYMLRFFSGNQFGAPNEIPLGKEVKPGEMVDITLQMKSPKNPGEYISTWVMSTANRANFKDPLYLTIVIPTPTKTPTLTKTPLSPSATPSATPTK